MKFINTQRFSPVIYEEDFPHNEDPFFRKPEECTRDFWDKGLYDIDEEWWFKQEQRCKYGFTVPNSIDFGGDAIVDEVDAFWNDSKEHERHIKDLDIWIPPNTCYIPQYEISIKNREVYITGRNYWYLNFWKIYGIPTDARDKFEKGLIEVVSKTDVSPKFLDMDYLFYHRVRLMFEKSKDDSEVKARQKGFSEKMAGGIAAYNYTFMRSSLTIIAGGQSDDADKTYLSARNGLKKLENTQFRKDSQGNNNNEYVHANNFGSEIRTVSCKDNNQALNRFSPFFVIYEEGGKWKKDLLLETSEFTEAATKAEGIKTGYKMFVGTGGSMDMGAADLETMHYAPDTHNILSFNNNFESAEDITVNKTGHFTAAWWYKIIDKDGNSLKKESIKTLYEEEAKKKQDKKITFWTQNPIYASQAFMVPTGGFFGESIINMLNIRRAYIKTHKEAQIEQVGILEWINPKKPFEGVKFINSPNGRVKILEEPMKDSNGVVYKNLYKAGTDSYDRDEALTSNSLGSVNIMKDFLNVDTTCRKYVARITERPGTSEGGKDIFYEDVAKLCIYYGQAINLIEHSNTLIFEWMDKNGFSSLLKERPQLTIATMVKKTQVANKWGIDANTKPHWLTKLRKYLEDPINIDKLDDLEQIMAFAKFRYNPGSKKYNCDITISSSLALVCLEDEQGIMVMSSNDKFYDDKPFAYREINGQLIQC